MFRHSSLKRPLKNTTNALSEGFPGKQHMDTAIAISTACLYNLFDPLAKWHLIITDRLVAVCPPVEAQHCATTALANPELVLEPADNLPPPIRR
jgi:hypothetical protein